MVCCGRTARYKIRFTFCSPGIHWYNHVDLPGRQSNSSKSVGGGLVTGKPKSAPTAFIAGGSSGIGKATAIRFAREGWSVVVAAPGRAAVEQVAQELEGKGHLAIDLDVTVDEQMAQRPSKFGLATAPSRHW